MASPALDIGLLAAKTAPVPATKFHEVRDDVCKELIDALVPHFDTCRTDHRADMSVRAGYSLVDIVRNYVAVSTLDQLLLGCSEIAIRGVLSKSKFPLHAIILSKIVLNKEFENCTVTLEDLGILGPDIADVKHFIAIRRAPLEKLAAARALGFDDPAICFLTPAEPKDSAVAGQEAKDSATAEPETYRIKTLDHEDLFGSCVRPSLHKDLGLLNWPHVERAIESIRDQVGCVSDD